MQDVDEKENGTVDSKERERDPRAPPELWQHQREAYGFIKDKPAALLAMDMGTGKTATVIHAMKDLQEGRVLVLCPKPVIRVWEREIDRHWPRGPYRVISLLSRRSTETTKKKKERAETALAVGGLNTLNIVLCNYEAAIQPALSHLFKSCEWDLVVLDESHRVKSPGGKASWLAKALGKEAKKRLCLTGTPLPHSPLDAYAQFRFLDPDVFGTSFTRFKQKYAVLGGFQGREVVDFQNLEDLETMAERRGR